MKKALLALTAGMFLMGMTGCSGITQNGKVFAAHGESFNLFGLQIPGDPMKLAQEQVPANAEVNTVAAMPDDTTSVLGILNRIMGWGYVAIGGEVKSDQKNK